MNNAKFGNKIYKHVGGADRAEADYGTGEGTSQMAPLKSSMRTAVQCSEIWQKRPPEPLRTSTSPMPTPTSTKSQHASEYGGNPRNLSPSGLRSHTLASAGIYVHARSTSWTRRGPNTWLPLRNGRRSAHTTSWTPRGCMESYSTPRWSYLQGELTSPAWRPCLPHSIMVLSFHTHPHGTPHSTSNGGNSSSAIQASQGLSCSPAAQLTTGHSRMPALGSELQSRLALGGVRGGWPLDGSLRGETSNGPKQSVSNYLSSAYARHHMRESTSWSTGITMASSRDGGKDAAPINPPTVYSDASSSYRKITTGLYTQNTYQVHRTPQTPLQGANTPPATSYLDTSLSPLKSGLSLLTSDPGELARKVALKPLV
jgi:hypothetical protein